MADKDNLPLRGIPFFAVVDGTGVASGGSLTVSQLRARGMEVICEVDSSGTAASGATMATLRNRGIPFYCPVTESGVAADATTMATLRNRSVPFFCKVGATGVAQSGTKTMAELAMRGIPFFCPLNESGNEITGAVNTLIAGTGTFVLSGEAMTPLVDYRISGAVGSFTLTGQDVTLSTTATGAIARQYGTMRQYVNTEASVRSFATFDFYVAA